MANFSEVVDSGYSCPKSMNLRIDFEEGVALDDNKKVIFRMEQYFSHRRRRVLLDASSNSICILHKKKSSMHGRWKVRKSDTSQLSFIVKKSSRSTSREHIDLDVFLPNNTEESFCKIKANRKKKSCEIYASGSTLANANAIQNSNITWSWIILTSKSSNLVMTYKAISPQAHGSLHYTL
ncbi:hypothetical protein RIF29_00240 [Crotalaria pallida]|uniref:Uncharacterized protein n=1 Tax=Crotalaria pallida TaxID=3830 RepID=A0AAN9IXA6_CROPI